MLPIIVQNLLYSKRKGIVLNKINNNIENYIIINNFIK